MRIDKTMKGEKVPFYLKMIPDTMNVEVRNILGEKIMGKIDETFTYILIPDEFTQWISGHGHLIVGKLKMPYSIRQSAMEYNEKNNSCRY